MKFFYAEVAKLGLLRQRAFAFGFEGLGHHIMSFVGMLLRSFLACPARTGQRDSSSHQYLNVGATKESVLRSQTQKVFDEAD